MLRLPSFSKSFEVEIDVSYMALGMVLLQDDHPVAYENKKLNDVDKHYSASIRKVQCY